MGYGYERTHPAKPCREMCHDLTVNDGNYTGVKYVAEFRAPKLRLLQRALLRPVPTVHSYISIRGLKDAPWERLPYAL